MEVAMTHRKSFPLLAGAAALAAALAGPAAYAAEAPAVGDTYVYRLVNGYNKETVGQLRYQLQKLDGGNATYSVTPDNPDAGAARTDVYTREGNWLRYPMENHGEKVDYEFSTAFPAYVFPLEPGKTWSVRVPARIVPRDKATTVLVRGRVMGTERIRVPAGEFDTVKIRRLVYPGDADYSLPETQVNELDWYAPALGRTVRTERRSQYLDLRACSEFGSCDYHGAWDVFELVEVRPAKR